MLGSRIRVLREAKIMSQSELGKLVGKPNSTICKIEKGKRRVFGDEIKLFADALGVSVNELLEANDIKPTGTCG